MATELFNKVIEVQVGDKVFRGGRISFKAKLMLGPKPNEGEVMLYNLSLNSIATLLKAKTDVNASRAGDATSVFIRAGWAGRKKDQAIPTIFKGQLRSLFAHQDGTDSIVTLALGDAEKVFDQKFSKQYKKKTLIRDILVDLATAMGYTYLWPVYQLNIKDPSFGQHRLTRGLTLSGSTNELFTQILASIGLNWTVTNGKLALFRFGESSDAKAKLLSPTTGLIGSPKMGKQGEVKVTSLISEGQLPGNRVKVESQFINGIFTILESQLSGDTHGDEMMAELKLSYQQSA